MTEFKNKYRWSAIAAVLCFFVVFPSLCDAQVVWTFSDPTAASITGQVTFDAADPNFAPFMTCSFANNCVTLLMFTDGTATYDSSDGNTTTSAS